MDDDHRAARERSQQPNQNPPAPAANQNPNANNINNNPILNELINFNSRNPPNIPNIPPIPQIPNIPNIPPQPHNLNQIISANPNIIQNIINANRNPNVNLNNFNFIHHHIRNINQNLNASNANAHNLNNINALNFNALNLNSFNQRLYQRQRFIPRPAVDSVRHQLSVSLNEIEQSHRMEDRNKKLSIGSVNEIRALEHQTLKVPYEILNKKFRVVQKTIDKGNFQVQNALSSLEKSLDNKDVSQEGISAGSVSAVLEDVVEKLKCLKRKSSEGISDEIQAVTVCKKRLEHLKLYTNAGSIDDFEPMVAVNGANGVSVINGASHTNSVNNVTMSMDTERWRTIRMDRFLVDHCLRQGFYETAMALSEEAGINDLTNIEIFLVCRSIEESLAAKDTSKCLAWCHDNKSKLRKINSSLEFRLRKQDFVELIRSNQRFAAVTYAQKHLSTFEDLPSIQKELEHVMGLLAYSALYRNDRYKDLLDEDQWSRLVTQFREENFKIYQLNSCSVFAMTLQAGLSSLKTLQCYRKDGVRNSECPVCSDLLNQLAVDLPCAHCSQSRLVCKISGHPMNENNPPLVLPNGHVYGELALKQMSLENFGKVICPRTNQVYEFDKLQKVFVM